MTAIKAEVLFREGDIGSGWEAGPAVTEVIEWGVKDAIANLRRDLFRSGQEKGNIFAAAFVSGEVAAAAVQSLAPLMTTVHPAVEKHGNRISPVPVSLLGDEAFGGSPVLNVPGMERLGFAPIRYQRVIFRQQKTIVFITLQEITADQLYAYARRVDERLQEQVTRDV